MISSLWILATATILGGAALWLLLPPGRRYRRSAGVLVGAISLGLLASQVPRLGNLAGDSVLLVLSTVTVVSAAAAMTMRNPVYCAIWFGMVLLGTAGLFLLQGAEFLAIATVIVYAGAILVTFLFLLMLADPQGRAFYDRTSWEASLSALAGAVIVGILSITTVNVLRQPPEAFLAAGATPEQRTAGVLADAHVQGIGQALFERHLVAVEVAGVLLLAALVGAAAIVAQGRVKRPAAVAGPTDQAAAAQAERQVLLGGQPRPTEPIPSVTEQHG